MKLRLRGDAAAQAETIARHIPSAEEAAVRDILALAGDDIAVALGRLAGALGALVAERSPPALHVALLAGATTTAARAAALRGARPMGQA
jgi:hypothetical protein